MKYGRLSVNIYGMKKLHLFGLTIITLVVAAFLNTPAFFVGLSKATKIEIIILIIFLILIALSAILRVFMNCNILPTWLPVIFGTILFITSGFLFFNNADYFLHAIKLPMPFWHRVSFYSLPAISLESAIVTGFEFIMISAKNLSKNERKKITSLFIFYTVVIMVINFLAIGKIFEVSVHVTIARLIIVFCIAVIMEITRRQFVKINVH
jgi:hypothetical protein